MGNSILEETFAIVDIETTGGSALRDRITEIAIISMQGWREIGRWSSLVNPGRHIPGYIQTLTGISNKMVEDAPAFSELADEVFELLDGKVFVAHNVRFDYGFLRNAFSLSGISFSAPMLCTVKLSRALYPANRRHNLDSVIRHHGLDCEERHRAMGDSEVLLQFLRKIHADHDDSLIESVFSKVVSRPALPPGLSMADIDGLPDSPGVYLFFDESDTCLYIGKSKAIRSRVLSHFSSDFRISKEMEIARQTVRIQAIPTAGELGALLKEISLVREIAPIYNRRLRPYEKAWSIRWSALEDPIMHPEVVSSDGFDTAGEYDMFGLFRSSRQAKRRLQKLAVEREMCLRTIGLETGEGACFAYQVGKCTGVCVGNETIMEHKIRIMQALLPIKVASWPYPGAVAIMETSANEELTEAHVFDNWRYLGKADSEPALKGGQLSDAGEFDIDVYNVVSRHLGKAGRGLKVIDMATGEFR